MPLFRSLRARVLLWVCVALTVLFAITIVGLDIAFQRSTDSAVEDLLEIQLLGLIALAEETPDQEISLPPDAVVNPQFAVADSGLFGGLWDADGVAVWASASLLGREIFLPSWPAAGEMVSFTVDQPDLPPLAAQAMGVTWSFSDGSSLPYTFAVAVSLEPYAERQAEFRRNLIGWFGGITITMLIVLTGLLTFVLRPLRRLERQVREVEAGSRQQLAGEIPSELAGLARNMNALIETERRRLVRYRHLLDDLAHSLKTPLAAMRTLLSGGRQDNLTAELDREVQRIDQRVSYQLRKARASGATGLGVEPTLVAPVVHDLVDTLDKVYRDKQVSCQLDLAPGLKFYGDQGDLSEMLGNLLDNAYKYCAKSVTARAGGHGGLLWFEVENDGEVLDEKAFEQLLERGARADESVPGQGIGLAVVQESVSLYAGRICLVPTAGQTSCIRIELRRPGFDA